MKDNKEAENVEVLDDELLEDVSGGAVVADKANESVSAKVNTNTSKAAANAKKISNAVRNKKNTL